MSSSAVQIEKEFATPPLFQNSASNEVVFVHNSELIPEYSFSATEFLNNAPRGAYTAMRSVHRHSIFEFEFHVDRLVKSVNLMLEAEVGEKSENVITTLQETSGSAFRFPQIQNFSLLRPLLVRDLEVAMREYLRREECAKKELKDLENSAPLPFFPIGSEMKIVVLITWGLTMQEINQTRREAAGLIKSPVSPMDEASADVSTPDEASEALACSSWPCSFDIFTHVSALGVRPTPPVKVEVRGTPRSNALAKDSQWVRDRQSLESRRPKDVNEILLMDEHGNVLEGTTSNFYAIIDGHVWTAQEGVLLGSVRETILKICKKKNIPVTTSPPNIHTIDRWQGAFISSTSRLALPISEITYAKPRKDADAEIGDVHKSFLDSACKLVFDIEQAVVHEVESNSSKILS